MGFLTGDAPTAEVRTLPTVTLGQQRQFTDLENILFDDIQSGERVPGSAFSNPIPLESLSLSALEQRSQELGGGGSQIEQATSQAILSLLSSGGGAVGGTNRPAILANCPAICPR